MELESRVAVVTGGSRGIGRAIAERFLAAGARVVISGKSPEKGQRALEEMGAGGDAAFVAADARSQSDTEGLVDFAKNTFGDVHILVNNAGGSSGFALLADLSDEAWREAADWNLNSAFWAIRRALPHMVAAKFGRIINISSVEAKGHITPTASHYGTFKVALNGLTRAVATEYGTSGITANSICPGAVETDLMKITGAENAAGQGLSYQEFLDIYAQQSLTKQLNTVDEVAAVAMLLASSAGAGITGTAINVDGGTSPF